MGLGSSLKKAFKPVKKIAGFAAPFAGFIPGVGILGAAALGGGLGALGGGFKGALGGALGAGGIAGGGALLGNALGAGSGAFGSAVGSGLLGAAGGALNGGLKGGLIGGALGGAGGYIQGSGGLGNAWDNLTGTAGGTGATGGLSSSYGSAFDDYDALAAADNPGFLTKAKDFFTGGTTLGPDDYSVLSSADLGRDATALGTTASSTPSSLTPLLSAGIGGYSNQRAEDQLLKGQQNAFNTLSPFLNSKFDASDLGNDAGYQFQLAEGNKAIDRAAAARGNFYSGQALQDAADFSKGLTDTTLQDAYNRYLSGQQQKIGVAGNLANIYGNQGDIRANATTNLGNIFTGSLAAATGGRGVNSSGNIVDPSGISNDTLIQLLRQRGLA